MTDIDNHCHMPDCGHAIPAGTSITHLLCTLCGEPLLPEGLRVVPSRPARHNGATNVRHYHTHVHPHCVPAAMQRYYIRCLNR